MSESGMSAVVDRADQVRSQFEVELEALKRDRTLTLYERKVRIYDLWRETRRVLAELRDVDFEAERKAEYERLLFKLRCFPDDAPATRQQAAISRVWEAKINDASCAYQLRKAVEEGNEILARAVIGVAVERAVVGDYMYNALAHLRADDFETYRQLRRVMPVSVSRIHRSRRTWDCARPVEIAAFCAPSSKAVFDG